MPQSFQSLCFIASSSPEACAAREELIALYGQAPLEKADVVVALGGAGFMLFSGNVLTVAAL